MFSLGRALQGVALAACLLVSGCSLFGSFQAPARSAARAQWRAESGACLDCRPGRSLRGWVCPCGGQ